MLRRAAELLDGTGVTLVLENLNTRVDHPGTLLDSVKDCVEVIRAVDAPGLALLYGLYHSTVMGEDMAEVIGDAMDLVAHVQIADSSGRGEPGSGGIDWEQRLTGLRELGYRGLLGLEYYPTQPTESSLKHLHQVLGR